MCLNTPHPPPKLCPGAIHLEENLRQGKDSSMKRDLKNVSLRGDKEEQRSSKEVGKNRRNGLKCQGKCRDNPKSVKECNIRSPSALYTGRACNTLHQAEGAKGEMGPSESSVKILSGRWKDQVRFRGTRKALRYERHPREGRVMQVHLHLCFQSILLCPS